MHEEVAEVGQTGGAAAQKCLESVLSGHLAEPRVGDERTMGGGGREEGGRREGGGREEEELSPQPHTTQHSVHACSSLASLLQSNLEDFAGTLLRT